MLNRHNCVILIASLTGITVCYFVTRFGRQYYRRFRRVGNRQIEVAETRSDVVRIVQQLRKHCEDYNVLGFDCEWITMEGERRPVALLQLATYRGFCALFRLCKLGGIPSELRQLLRDEDIVKVGVGSYFDANYLAKDYGVSIASILDLRYMSTHVGYESNSLGKTAEIVIGVIVEKNWSIRCSNWELDRLTNAQMDYASEDALVSIEIFDALAIKLKKQMIWTTDCRYIREIINEVCLEYLDRNFDPTNILAIAERHRNPPRPPPKKKERAKKSAAMSRPYENCRLLTPDGELLATVSSKKAKWYIAQSLVDVIADSPLTIQLRFEPVKKITYEYNKVVIANRCVVCGETKSLARKHVVPLEYKKHFERLRETCWTHDILLLCLSCHKKSYLADLELRKELAKKCDTTLHGRRVFSDEVIRMKKMQSIAKELLRDEFNLIPTLRKFELRQKVLEYFPEETKVTDDLLHEAIDMKVMEEFETPEMVHGEKVVEYYELYEGGDSALEVLWREHFVNTMNPMFLPDTWSVDFNHERSTFQ